MAISLADLFVFLKGDDSHLEKTLDGAEKKTTSAAGNIAKLLGGAIVGGAALAGSAILAIGGKAFDVATEIDAATDQIGASLGLGADEAKAYGEAIKSVYGDNFGDSIEDVGGAVETVAKQLRLAANDPALPKMTSNAFRLRDVFGVEVNESIDAVKTLMENFGVSSEEAFDLLTTGYQRGLDRSGDFLDTIGEYSNQFAEGGASAVEFFSTLDTGLQGGMLGTDKAADAFKEFRLRIQDGSTLTADSLAAIGLSADEITEGLTTGGLTVVDVWDMVQRGMQETEDPLARFNAGVGLIGSQFEDLGEKAILGIDITEDWAEGGLSSVDTLDAKYTSLGGVIEGMWRKFQVGIAPAGEAMLNFVNDNLPLVEGVVSQVSETVAGFINAIPVVISDMRTKWDEDWAGIRTTWTAFKEEMPREHAEFWAEWQRTFNAGSDENRITWEEFFNGLNTFATSWWRLTVENWTLSLTMIRGIWQTFSNVFKGEWEASWNGFALALNSVTDIMLNYIEFAFGPGLRDAMAGALNGAWDKMREIFGGIAEWWNNSFGRLFGQLENPATPNLGIVNPANAANRSFLDGINNLGGFGGPGTLSGAFPTQPAGGSYNINVKVDGTNATYENGREVGRGVNDELRRRGH